MNDSKTTHVVEEEAAGLSLIDGSASDDDFLLASSSDVTAVGNPGGILAEAHMNQPSDSIGSTQHRKNGKCNLRKSLAWDSAFFTSAGVLDPEELSSIIERAETSMKQKHFLPGIDEDLSKSYDSVSTFESDNLTLESLEAELFCDIRDSIQRTTRPSVKGTCRGTKTQGETKSTNGCSTKTVENSLDSMVKSKLATKKPNPSVQGTLKTLKPRSVSKQVVKPVVRTKESKSLLPRSPELVVKPSSVRVAPTKGTTVSAGRAKLESNVTGNSKGKAASLSKVSYQANSSTTVPKTLASSKFSSASSVLGRAAAVRSSRSCDSSSSSSSGSILKSTCDVNRRKMDKNVNVPSGSKIGAPSSFVVKSKSRSGNSKLSYYLKSRSKLSSSISPTSSISEWSTESSSSTATINQKHIGLTPYPISAQHIIMDSSVPQPQNHSSDSASRGHENQLAGLDQSAKQPSTRSAVSLFRPGSAKPSGLRMPSAKIGYFDGVKAAAKTPSSGGSRSRSALPSNQPRCAALTGSPSGTVNKPKTVIEPEPRRTDTNLKPVRLEDQSTGLQKTLNAENVEHGFETSSKISEDITLKLAFEENGEVLNGGKHVAASSSEATKEINLVAAHKGASLEGKLPSSTSQATIPAEDVHNITCTTDGLKDICVTPSSKEVQRKESSVMGSGCLSQEVGEYDSLKIGSTHACQDAGGSVEQGLTNENRDLGNEAVEAKKNPHAEKEVDGFAPQVEATNNEMVMRSKSNGRFQSHNLIHEDNSSSVASCPKQLYNEKSMQSANLSPVSLALLDSKASPGTRTPFAIKNSVADLIEVYNSSSGLIAEALVKSNTLPSLEEGQKENC